KLNDSPLAWGRVLGCLVTHPTTEARGLRVGRRAGIAPERVRELLTQGLPSHGHYGHAERPGEEARVFSAAWKTRTTSRISLAMLAAAVVAPAAALAIAIALGWSPPHAIAIVCGFVLGLAATLLTLDRLAARPVGRLEAPLRARFGEEAGSADWFVALSPGDRPRIYECFLDWDLGLLA